jgi:hypothetical protein
MKINELVPGEYKAIWCAYQIHVEKSDKSILVIPTIEGMRGIVDCIVKVDEQQNAGVFDKMGRRIK